VDFDLDTVLLTLGKETGDVWTARNAVEGVQVFGGIGSGKTSGSGRRLAMKYLQASFGGLVLTVKPDEADLWKAYCQEAGRSQDLILVQPGGAHRFNFLNYESDSDSGEVFTQNIVQVLKTVIRAGDEKSSGKSDDGFWEAALDLLIYNTIDLCLLAYSTVSVQKLYDIVQSAARGDKENPDGEPTAFEQAFLTAKETIENLDEAWHESLRDPDNAWNARLVSLEVAREKAIPQIRLYKFVHQFFIETYRQLAEKTRSIIDFSFSSFLYNLLREPAYSLFCSGSSTFKPEDTLDGKIILLNLPVKNFHRVGRDCQILFKYIWQRAMERRDIRENGRPVFLWADEAQHFLHEHDAEFQATARSSRVATVYLTQNLPNYYAAMGGEKSEYRVKSFLGTLATKIFHANSDIETNKYASDLIGEIFFDDVSRSSTVSGEFSSTRSMSMRLEKAVRAEEFTTLKTGSPKNDHTSTAYLHCQGTRFSTGGPYIKVKFKQKS